MICYERVDDVQVMMDLLLISHLITARRRDHQHLPPLQPVASAPLDTQHSGWRPLNTAGFMITQTMRTSVLRSMFIKVK